MLKVLVTKARQLPLTWEEDRRFSFEEYMTERSSWDLSFESILK